MDFAKKLRLLFILMVISCVGVLIFITYELRHDVTALRNILPSKVTSIEMIMENDGEKVTKKITDKEIIKDILNVLSDVRIDRTSNTSTKGGLEVIINHKTGVMYELSITETIISIDGTCHKANKDCYNVLKTYLISE